MLEFKVLIVDDNPAIRRSLGMLFECIDSVSALYFAESGEKALEVLPRLDINLVSMDVRMTGMDGIQTTQELKRINPFLSVIAYSSDESTRESSLQAGADYFLVKPSTVRSIENILELVALAHS